MSPAWLEEIRRDNTSGAAALAAKAARGLAAWAATERGAEQRVAVVRELLHAQPRMAPLVNLAQRFLEAGPDAVLACREFLEQLETNAAAVARHGAELVAEGVTVLTHSFSSSVLGALRGARAEGRRFSVIATESRPMCEGVALARELAAAGISVRLIVDAAAGLFIPEARLVLLGADALTVQGVINKVGSLALALAAREHGVPVYVVAGSDKFLPSGYRLPAEPLHAAEEVLAQPVPGVTVLNYYFELTPLELVAGVVTEEGPLALETVRKRLARKTLHPALREL